MHNPDTADYILIGTCAFKADEEAAALESIERYRHYRARKIVLGCLPEITPRRYHECCSFDYVPPRCMERLDDLLEGITSPWAGLPDTNSMGRALQGPNLPRSLERFVREFSFSSSFLERSLRFVRRRLSVEARSYYLAVCRGCLGTCTYCAIRNAVGRVRSKPIAAILEEFRAGMASGHRKFVILGDDVGAYGQDIGESFPQMLSALIAETGIRNRSGTRDRGIGIHIEELNPRWIVRYLNDLLPLLSCSRIKSVLCPLQSGSDRILGLMDRHHTIEAAASALSQILTANPKLELDTQIIVGFPSETEQDFFQTLSWLGRLRPHQVTLFAYDEKENTPSSRIAPKVAPNVIRQRIEFARKYLRKRRIQATLSCVPR